MTNEEILDKLRENEHTINIIAGILKVKPDNIVSTIEKELARKEQLETEIASLTKQIHENVIPLLMRRE